MNTAGGPLPGKVPHAQPLDYFTYIKVYSIFYKLDITEQRGSGKKTPGQICSKDSSPRAVRLPGKMLQGPIIQSRRLPWLAFC